MDSGKYLAVGVWVALGIAIALGVVWAIEEIKGFPLRGAGARARLELPIGIFKRETVTVPFNRIQHSEVVQGPVARAFDVCTLKLYTAGNSGANLRVPGMDVERAKRLRQQLDERVSNLIHPRRPSHNRSIHRLGGSIQRLFFSTSSSTRGSSFGVLADHRRSGRFG